MKALKRQRCSMIILLLFLPQERYLEKPICGVMAAEVPSQSLADMLAEAYAAGYADGIADTSQLGEGSQHPRNVGASRFELNSMTDEELEALGSLFCADHMSAHQLSPALASVFVRKVDASTVKDLVYNGTARQNESCGVEMTLDQDNIGRVVKTLSGILRVRAAWSPHAAKLLSLPQENLIGQLTDSKLLQHAWQRFDKWGAAWFDGEIISKELTSAGAAAVIKVIQKEVAKPHQLRRQNFMEINNPSHRLDYPLPLSCVGEDADADENLFWEEEPLCSIAPKLLESVVDVAFPLLKLAVGEDALLMEATSITAFPCATDQPRHADTNVWMYHPEAPEKSSALMVSIFVPLVHTSSDMGALDMWLGTHTQFGVQSEWALQQEFIEMSAAVRMSGLSPGSLIFMDSRLQHRGSGHAGRTSISRPVV